MPFLVPPQAETSPLLHRVVSTETYSYRAKVSWKESEGVMRQRADPPAPVAVRILAHDREGPVSIAWVVGRNRLCGKPVDLQAEVKRLRPRSSGGYPHRYNLP